MQCQFDGKLHVYEIPLDDDIQNLISNGKCRENVWMLYYWIRKLDEKARLLGTFINWEDAIFLGAIAWNWFLQELAFNRGKTQ